MRCTTPIALLLAVSTLASPALGERHHGLWSWGYPRATCYAWVGDWNGDGAADVAIAERHQNRGGAVHVVCGRSGKRIASFTGDADVGFLGRAIVTAPDIDGDGERDLVAVALRDPVNGRGVRLALIGSRERTVVSVGDVADSAWNTRVALRSVNDGRATTSPEDLLVVFTWSHGEDARSVMALKPFARGGVEMLWRRDSRAGFALGNQAVALLPASGAAGATVAFLEHDESGSAIAVVAESDGRTIRRIDRPETAATSFASEFIHVPGATGESAGWIVARSRGSPVTANPLSGRGILHLFDAESGHLVRTHPVERFEEQLAARVSGRELSNGGDWLGEALAFDPVTGALLVADPYLSDGVVAALDMPEGGLLAAWHVWPPEDWGVGWGIVVEPPSADGVAGGRVLIGLSPDGAFPGVLVCERDGGKVLTRIPVPTVETR